MYCGRCGKEVPDGMEYCSMCQFQIKTQTEASAATVPDMPMKWYKFLIYFLLFASMVINTLSGFGYISGIHYLGMANEVYTAYPAMKAVDFVMGIFSIGYAVFALFTRMHLARFSKTAPSLIIWFYSLNPICNILYTGAVSLVLGQSAFDSNFIGRLLGFALVLACNVVYFKKRAHLFVN